MATVTREKTALLTVLKDTKRPDLLSLCKIHDIKGLNRARNLLEVSLAEHCVAEHSGRVVNLGKCEKNTLSSSTSSKPLVPLKRATTDPSRPGPSGTSDANTLRQIQEQLTELKNNCLTQCQVEDIVNAKLEAQQAEFQAALDELHGLCQESFSTIQASFQDVDSWREEVTDTFAAIQSWASDIEKRVLASSAVHTTPALPKNRFLGTRRSSPFSSTPFGRDATQPHQTPALDPIASGAPLSKRIRLSDASECSLATIPEQLMTPDGQLVDEDPMLGMPLSHYSVTEAEDDVPERISKVETELPASATLLIQAESQSQPLLAQAASGTDVDSSVQSDAVTIKKASSAPDEAMRTPAAAKTLFGTERSADERFEDAGRVSDISSHSIQWGVRAPLWLQRA